jgi:Coenzyme PQQ synthesis protein D (PqqD)
MTRAVGDETVLLDLAAGTYYGLDAVGARIWELMAGGHTLQAVCEQMLKEFEVSEPDISRDVLTLAQALLDKKLLAISV